MNNSPTHNSNESATSALTEQNSLTLYLRVRYSECDAQGIVFNARYADFADLADTEYFRALVGDFHTFVKSGFDKQVVHYECQWHGPAYFDDVLKLTANTIRVGNTSYTVKVECERVVEGELIKAATMTMTYVVVSVLEYKKAQIPEHLRLSFQKSFDKTVNQSGQEI